MNERQVSIEAVANEVTMRAELVAVRLECRVSSWIAGSLAVVIYLISWAIYGMHPLSELETVDLWMTMTTCFLCGVAMALNSVSRWLKEPGNSPDNS